MSLISENFSENFSELSLEEKIETILSMLNTPIFRRKIGDNDFQVPQHRLIMNTCYEFQERKQNDKA